MIASADVGGRECSVFPLFRFLGSEAQDTGTRHELSLFSLPPGGVRHPRSSWLLMALSVVSSSVLEESDATKPPSVNSESEDEDDVEHNGDPPPALQLHTLHFMGNHGKNIQLSHGNRTATRVCSYNQGIVVLTQPLPPLFLFQVRIDQLSPCWTSSLSIGVIGVSPERLNFPATAAALKRSAWIFQRSAVLYNGAKIREGYGPNLDLCPEGTCVGLLLDSSGGLHLYINGLDQGVGTQDLPELCYVVIDLYGQCVSRFP
ncbi:unnamed protein product [Ranitomeya imitator]|uniref:NHR domain-containing protein n=1 Tax=Ranitomeya imitator TaxID=111125 RepID=A0ABN9M262_9NEOB|nr:unnamed protein product [Ranitomeya imitator]